ncbi:unnamed protein product [Prorocentrum cordatum]|uniref:GS catalytic domain-containing protein n=1 Tax=Prorocentrum cordatum TaxID=2364126 RepID=A0ABN9PS15_9DINO|nr:unnamed protein product [Polarella glacialis]
MLPLGLHRLFSARAAAPSPQSGPPRPARSGTMGGGASAAAPKVHPETNGQCSAPTAGPGPEGADGKPVVLESSLIFDDATMKRYVPAPVFKRFLEDCVSGAPTSEEDQKAIADGMFRWAREKGCTDFAHWFFPVRGGSGAVGGAVGALKMDTLVDLDFKSGSAIKPFFATLPHERLFQGETDGSSFPNGGLRVTHSAAAFTVWDRTSPPIISGTTLRIPCSFLTHFGKSIDDKTPLLRSQDAVSAQGMRLLRALGLASDAKCLRSYLGWEQEFFVVSADLYKKRPDLVNTGRTLFGKLPTRGQQMDLNYFAPVPELVDKMMAEIQQEMLRTGTPMAVRHNEVAPGQHEMSPIFGLANWSADNNVYFMEACNRIAAKYGLMVLFHEKPFAGINGSGKHANWSVGTDTGINPAACGKQTKHALSTLRPWPASPTESCSTTRCCDVLWHTQAMTIASEPRRRPRPSSRSTLALASRRTWTPLSQEAP